MLSVYDKSTVLLQFSPQKVVSITAARLQIKSPEEMNSYLEVLSDIPTSLSTRSNECTYMVLTCITTTNVGTYLVVSSDDIALAKKELEIACALIETLSKNAIQCQTLDSNTLIKLIMNCLTGYRYRLLQLRGREDNAIGVLHTIPLYPEPPSSSVTEYEYLATTLTKGNIRIGVLLSNPDIEVKLTDDHIFRHIAIFGSTGSGKSTTGAIIALEASRNGYAVVIIDWHGEYLQLLNRAKERVLYANPLNNSIPEALNLEELVINEPLAFIEVLESALELTPAQAHILEDAVNILRQRKDVVGYIIDILLDIIQTSAASARWFAESREALIRKLKPLTSRYLSVQWNKAQKLPIENGKILVFDLSSIPNVRVKKVLASLFIRSLTLKAQYNTIAKPLLIVVDEAHNILDSDNPISSLIAEVRKWKVGFVIISQAPSMIASTVIKNTNTKIIHSLKSSQDINSVIASIASDRQLAKYITTLRPGEALLVLPELAIPTLIKIKMEYLSE